MTEMKQVTALKRDTRKIVRPCNLYNNETKQPQDKPKIHVHHLQLYVTRNHESELNGVTAISSIGTAEFGRFTDCPWIDSSRRIYLFILCYVLCRICRIKIIT